MNILSHCNSVTHAHLVIKTQQVRGYKTIVIWMVTLVLVPLAIPSYAYIWLIHGVGPGRYQCC